MSSKKQKIKLDDKEKKEHKKTFYEKFFKRFFDVLISFLALIILSPLFLFIFIFSKIFIKGKVIFSQYRPGKNGKIFKLYKFRSMTNKTDENGNLLPDDQRITKYGKFLRKLSLDELPQLWNILKGDMSIIGPRPRLVKDMIFYDKEVFKAYAVRPGLTGLAQVMGGRSEASWQSIFENDLKYSQKITFWGDVKIFFKTIGAIFKSDSASSGAGEGKREYYYSDHLLKQELITKEQYDLGLKKAEQIIKNGSNVVYDEKLHNDNKNNGEK